MAKIFAGLSFLGMGFSGYKLWKNDFDKPAQPIKKDNVVQDKKPIIPNEEHGIHIINRGIHEPDNIRGLEMLNESNTPPGFIAKNADLVKEYNRLLEFRNDVRFLARQPVFGFIQSDFCECQFVGSVNHGKNTNPKAKVYVGGKPYIICTDIFKDKEKPVFKLGVLNGQYVHTMN